jgi:type IV pilus assembly protein PilW
MNIMIKNLYFTQHLRIILSTSSNIQKGFTLIELLIALAVGSLLLTGIYNFYITQSKIHAVREQVAEMHQNARIGMALMTREIRMAGYDPTGQAGAAIIAATPTSIQVTIDLNEDGVIGGATGPDEDLTYLLYDSGGDGDLDLGRKPGGGSTDPVAENFASLAFSYTLTDGTVTDSPSAEELSQIRQVKIVLTAQTAWPDSNYPDNGGHRTYTLQSVITPRNLAY